MTREHLQDIFRQPYNIQIWQQLLITLFGATNIRQTPSQLISDTNEKVDGFELGRIQTPDHFEIGLFAFEIKGGTNIKLNRVGLRSLVKSYTRYNVDAAIVVYYDKEHWRLSFVCDLKEEKTAPKRFTYVFGNSYETYRTAAERLIKLSETRPSFEAIKDAFSVDKLSKDFFRGYKELYNKFCKYIDGSEKWQRDYVKKMMGRLVFLQFLQKKGWMGVPANKKDWLGGDMQYMQNLINRHKGNEQLLSDVLEPLFFDTLNKKREGDIADPCLGDNIKIPYLNGGLFEKDKLDEKQIDFPYTYFSDLTDFFAQYNFTIDENDPNDTEIGIDPEMLGHIFENLLEDNKDKGAFYTPKEIVQYMCRQSLIEYLQSKLGKHIEIENFINNHDTGYRLDSKNFIVANARMLESLLDNVKICDPAIGSGAFPMGILNEIFQAKMALNMTLDRATVKKSIIQNTIYGIDLEQGAVDIARLRFWLSLVVEEEKPEPLPNLDYKIVCGNSLLSRNTLETSLDNVFSEYNKTRIDEDKLTIEKYQQIVSAYTNTPNNNIKEKYKRLISEIKQCFATHLNDSFRYFTKPEKKLINKYASFLNLDSQRIFKDYITENKLSAKGKKELSDIRKSIEEKQSLVFQAKYNKLYKDAFEWRYEFPALLNDENQFTGFDIVIGNPPYLRIQGIRDTDSDFADELINKYDAATGSFDLYALFVERGLQIIKNDGIVNYIMPIKWTNAAFGKGLRVVVTDKKAACKIINFGAYQVFNASTYTALQWFKPNSKECIYYELDRNLGTNQELGEYLNSLSENDAAKINADKLSKDTWVLTVGQTSKILSKLEQHPLRVSDIFDRIFCGLQTSKDDIYFLYECTENNGVVTGMSKYLDRRITVERGLVKPLLKGEDVHRYDNISTDRFVIFPYKLEENKANLYDENEIANLFPFGYAYLKECEQALRDREKGRLRDDDFWFRYIYPKNLILFNNEKLVAPEISLGGNFAYDQKGEFYSTTKIYGYLKKESIEESYKFWMGLFNSRLFWFYIQNTGYVLRGGYYTFKTNYINPFPIPAKISSEIEKIVCNLVDMLTYLYDKNNPDIFDHTPNKRVRVHIEDILNMVVYELYFGEHMKEKGIDVVVDLLEYKFNDANISAEVKDFYSWYQKSENMIRQKLMLLDSRSNEFIYLIHTSAAL